MFVQLESLRKLKSVIDSNFGQRINIRRQRFCYKMEAYLQAFFCDFCCNNIQLRKSFGERCIVRLK